MTKFEDLYSTYVAGHTNHRLDFDWFMEAFAASDFCDGCKFYVYVVDNQLVHVNTKYAFPDRDTALAFIFDQCTMFNARLLRMRYNKIVPVMAVYLAKERDV